MRSARWTLAALALCAACEAADRGTAPAGEPEPPSAGSAPVILRGSLDPRIRAAADLGRMDPGVRLEGMTLTFAPSGTRQERDALLLALQSGGSPSYHRWLTPEQYADRFGASPADVERVSEWLGEQGFEVLGPSRGRTSLAFSGTVAQLERVFRTEMHRYALHGEPHFALAVEPAVPPELAGVVRGLRNVHDFRLEPPIRPVSPDYKRGTTYELAPSDWATIYDVAGLYGLPTPIDGTGQKIAVVGQAQVDPTDVQVFRTTFGLDAANLPKAILVPKSGAPSVPSAAYLAEATLDLEWAGAIAKNAKIQYVFVGDAPNYGVVDAAFYAIDQAIAPVVSFSYGGCENGYSATEADYLGVVGDYASMLGITFVAASGDGGAAACDAFDKTATHGISAGYPASMPGAVAVGGTMLYAQPPSAYFDATNDAISYIPERGWNDTPTAGYLFASTGGVSRVFPKPYWQVGVTPNDGMRDLPDVAFAASLFELPYVVELNGAQVTYGGTSCAAPSFAAVLALVNQAIALANPGAPPGLGNANPVLYALANGAGGGSIFHDVQSGDDSVPCAAGSPDCTGPSYQFGYSCSAGYDLVTGNGSVDAYQLALAWSTLTPTGTQLSVATTGTTEGSTLTLGATVSSSGIVNALSGAVVFYYTSPDAAGSPAEGGMLGTVPVTPTSGGGTQGATAQLVTHAPPGLTGRSTVSAFYSGDDNYLASWSATQSVTATATFAVSPPSATSPTCGTVQFTTTGGVAPVTWDFFNTYSASNGTIGIHTGLYRAGGVGGVTDTVVARDAFGAMALGTVAVGTSGCPLDAGLDADASLDGSSPLDTGIRDALGDWYRAPVDAAPVGAESIVIPDGAPRHSGCGCGVAGAREPRGTAAMAAWITTVVAVAGRRRRRRGARRAR